MSTLLAALNIRSRSFSFQYVDINTAPVEKKYDKEIMCVHVLVKLVV